MASAARHGLLLQSKVLGRASGGSVSRAGKENGVGSAPSFPPPPRDPQKEHQKGRGRPPASNPGGALTGDDAPAEASHPAIEANAWGAPEDAIQQQLDRELASLRAPRSRQRDAEINIRMMAEFEALRAERRSDREHQQRVQEGMLRRLEAMQSAPATHASSSSVRRGPPASATSSERPSSAASSASLSSLASSAAAPAIDKEKQRLAKRVATFEALIVRKLIARTPVGPTGVGALKVLCKGFEYYDAENEGTVGVAELTQVLARLNVICALPPSDDERVVIGALFAKHANRQGELVYYQFAKALLRSSGTLVPAAEVREKEERERWQYSTAVQQALDRRNLGASSTTPPEPGPREAWVEASAAARAAEETLAYRVPPQSKAEGAALRGRLAGGATGWHDYQKRERGLRAAELSERAVYSVDARKLREEERAAYDARQRDALDGWRRIDAQNERLKGLAPGMAAAAARRRVI